MRPTNLFQRRGIRHKIFAIASVGAVLGIGATATLAAWNDNEWVVGGTAAGGAGIGTSTFDVWQNREQAPTNILATWDDKETELAAGGLTFSTGTLALTPGDSTYAPVAIQTKTGSIAGSLILQAPVKSTAVAYTDPSSVLWGALQYSVQVTETAKVCTAGTWATFGTAIANNVDFDAALTPTSQTVAANRGNIQYYCFKVTLPAEPAGVTDLNTLQGLTSAPAWRFAATSTTTSTTT